MRILTLYNRPIYKTERQCCEAEGSSGGSHAMTNYSVYEESGRNSMLQQEKKPIRPLSPWITDILLAAPLGIRSDYFRWWVFFVTITNQLWLTSFNSEDDICWVSLEKFYHKCFQERKIRKKLNKIFRQLKLVHTLVKNTNLEKLWDDLQISLRKS